MGLSTDPLPTDPNFECENFNTFWTEMNWSSVFGPKLDELMPLLEVCQNWSFEKRKRLGLLVLLVKGIYAVHPNSRIPVTSAKRVFDDEALRSYPWGRIAFEHLVVSVRLLNPQGKSYTLSGMKDVLIFWVYESVTCFGERFGRGITSNEVPLLRWAGNRTRSKIETAISDELKKHGEVRTRKMMVMKETLAEQFVQWPDETDDPQLVNLITDIYEDRFVRGFWEVQRNVNENENENEKKNKKKNKVKAASPIDSEQPAKKRKKGAAVDNAEAKGTDHEESEDCVGNDAAARTILKVLADIVAKLPHYETNIIEGVAQALEGMEKTIGDRVNANVVEGLVPRMDRVEDRAATHDDGIEQLRERVTALEKASGNVGSGEHKVEHSKIIFPKEDNFEQSVNSPAAKHSVSLDETESKGRSHDKKKNQEEEEESRMKKFDDLEIGGTNGTSPVAENTPSKESVVNKTNLEDELCRANDKGLANKVRILTDKSSNVRKDLSIVFCKETFHELGLADFVTVSPAKVPQDGTKNLNAKTKSHKVSFAANVKKNDREVPKKSQKSKVSGEKEQAPPTLQAKEKSLAQMKKDLAEVKRQAKAAKVRHAIGSTSRNLRSRGAPVIEEKTTLENSSIVEDVTNEHHARTYIQLQESEEDEDEKLRINRIIEYRSKFVMRPDGTAAKSQYPPRPPFPFIGDNGLTCMRKGCEPSKAIYDPIAPADPDKVEKINAYLDNYLATKLGKGSEEVEFYRQLVTPRREWISSGDQYYGWVNDNHIHAYMSLLRKKCFQDPCPFYSKRICFLDSRFVNSWKLDYHAMFRHKPSLFKILGTPYEKTVLGEYPADQKTKRKWIEDVDHVFGIQQTGGCHWVAFHVDLQNEKIDCYDSIMGPPTKESEDKMVDEFRPFMEMIPVMLNEALPNTTRKPSKKQFSFRRRRGRNIPQNLSPGDCGVYSLKYVECLALGLTFHGLCDANMQGLRVNMAAKIMAEEIMAEGRGMHSDLQ